MESSLTPIALWLGAMMIPRATGSSDIAPPCRNRAEPVEIWRARTFIHEHSDEQISLAKVAKMVKMSPTHLSEKFKEVTGINFVEYIARWPDL